MSRSKEKLVEYVRKFGDVPPAIVELPYESAGYQIMIEYALRNNEKLTLKKVGELIEEFRIRFGVVDKETADEDNFANKLYSKEQNDRKSF